MQRIGICFNVPKKDQTLIGPELVKIYIIEDDLNPKSNILKLVVIIILLIKLSERVIMI